MGVSFRFIHAAEIRLDASTSAIGQLPVAVAAAVRDASLTAFDRLVEMALSEEVAFVLISGEIGAEPERGLRAIIHLRDGLRRLAERGIEVVIAVDNDDLLPHLPIDSWPDSVVTTRPGGQPVEVRAAGGPIASIAWAETASELADLPGPIRIGLLSEHHPEEPADSFDYVACTGRREYAVEDEYPPRLSPGTLQGRGFSPDEIGAKGALLVSVEEHRTIDHEFVSLDAVRFVSIDLVVDGPMSLLDMARSLAARLDAVRSLHAGSPLIVEACLSLTGGGMFPGGWPEAREELLGLLRNLSESLQPLVWWARANRRYAALTGWSYPDRKDDFAGGVLELASHLIADPPERAPFVGDRSGRHELDGLAETGAVRQFVEQVQAEAAGSAELMRDAAELALDALAGQSGREWR